MKKVKNMVMVLVGNVILAFSIAVFLERTGLITGGTTGVGKVVYSLTSIPVSGTYAVINVVCFGLGLWILGKEFALTTLVSTVIFPPILRVMEVTVAKNVLTDDLMLCAIFAGLLCGLGVGLVMRAHSSTGGLDIPPLIIHRLWGIPVGKTMMVFSIVIIIMQIPFSSTEQILYGIIQIMIMSFVLDKVLMTGNSQAKMWIISPKYRQIQEKLLENDIGVTLFPIETGYTGQQQKAILCAVPPRRIPKIKELLKEVDPGSFALVDSTEEVLGQGFSLPRVYKNDEGPGTL